jgi:hypothetical protein
MTFKDPLARMLSRQGQDGSPAPFSIDVPASNRRVFLRRAGGMLAIGIPALRLLAGPSEAGAAASCSTTSAGPDASCKACCNSTYLRLDYTGCGIPNEVPHGCPKGDAYVCYGNYTIYSSNCSGFVCGQETLNDGTCDLV